MKKALIIGGGMAGCTAALELAKKNWRVTLLEKNKYLGGGCRTFFYGGHPYTEGPRPLYTLNPGVLKHFKDIIPIKKFKSFLLMTYIESDGKFYSYPIHYGDIKKMPDSKKIMSELKNLSPGKTAKNFAEFWKFSVGETLYRKFIDRYSKKMWKIESNTVIDDFAWSVKCVPLNTKAKEEYTKVIHAYPFKPDGYNQYFDFCVKDAKVYLDTEITRYDPQKRRVYVQDEAFQGDLMISTISPDDLMAYRFGKLRYMGRDFFKIVLPVKRIFPRNYNFIYYANDEPFTRIVEYKTLTRHQSPTTLLGMEIPSLNGKLYPFTIRSEQAKAERYFKNLPRNVYSIGRMGSYRYLNIGNVVESVWELMEKINS